MSNCDIKTLDTRIVYKNQWMRVREDDIERRDGSKGLYGVVEKSDFAVIVPISDDGHLHLVEQYRYPVGARYWELPQGAWEDKPGASPLEVARGELLEETGLESDDLAIVGHLFQAYGYSTQGYHIFVARQVRQVATDRSVEEQDLVTSMFPMVDVETMIRKGEIKDATTVATIGLLRLNGIL